MALGHKACEGTADQVREPSGVGESGVSVLNAGEAGGEVSGGEEPADVQAKGEVMRGIGEGGCGEKERAGR